MCNVYVQYKRESAVNQGGSNGFYTSPIILDFEKSKLDLQ